jgi:hypothetical protein
VITVNGIIVRRTHLMSMEKSIMAMNDYPFRTQILNTYYPGLSAQLDKPEAVLPCPSCGKNCVFDDVGGYECKECHTKGMVVGSFLEVMEGIAGEDVVAHFQALQRKDTDVTWIPLLTDIDGWHDALMTGQDPAPKDYLNTTLGISDQTLHDLKIGYDDKEQNLVLPIFNATGKGLAGTKYIRFKNGEISARQSIAGEVKIWGYHDLRVSAKGDLIFIAKDEFDAMVLKQNGFIAVCHIDGFEGWTDNHRRYFKGKSVVICSEDSEEQRGAAYSIVTEVTVKSEGSKILLFAENSTLHEYIKRVGGPSGLSSAVEKLSVMTLQKIQYLQDYAEQMAGGGKTKTIHLAQDVIDGKISYCATINSKYCLIYSGQEYEGIDDIVSNKKYEFYADSAELKFSTGGIHNYMTGMRQGSDEVFHAVREHIKKYVFFKNDDIYTVLAIWAMGTYVYRIFSYFPYIHINAEKGSGKSMLMEVLCGLCFNGDMSVGSTEAVIFRKVNNNSPTLFLDEAESFNKSKSQKMRAILGVLNSGYSQTGKVSRVEAGKVVNFYTYSPKMFAGIEELTDTLLDRSIKIYMVKKLATESVDKYDKIGKASADTIRDQLYCWGLNEGPRVWDKYEHDLATLPYLQSISNRQHDVWAPLLIIGDNVDSVPSGCVDTLTRYLAEDEYFHKVANQGGNMTHMLIEALDEIKNNIRPAKKIGNLYRYKTETVFKNIQSKPELKSIKTVNMLTKQLGIFGIKSENRSLGGKTHKCYDIDLNELSELKERYKER